MQGSNFDINTTSTKIIKTDIGAKDGQNKCPKCGATDCSLNMQTGRLRCNFCRHEFAMEQVSGFENDISNLQGQVIGSGASDIIADTKDILTFKCSSCGAEVVIDTSNQTQARCHWCRNILSVNQQIPNGSIPDVVLPFQVTKDVAKKQIEEFVGKRKFFAHPKFQEEFNTENIMGVYFPYMVVDVNSHVRLDGEGEHLVRTYTRSNGNTNTTYYDADLYQVRREFDIAINGLTVESSSDKLNNSQANKTNNVINAIMPFDIENCVKFNANYLKGYTSEKRDTNIDQLRQLVDTESKDIARHAANETLTYYDRGVAWSNEQYQVIGQQWKAAYLPVWLYSYQQVNGNQKILHYVAVNARTKETMGSVPIHMPKLLGVSLIVEIIGVIAMALIDFDYDWLFLLSGFIYFMFIYFRYRNSNARHKYETETKKQMRNVQQADNYIQRRNGLTNTKIKGVNNNVVKGNNFFNSFINNSPDSNRKDG